MCIIVYWALTMYQALIQHFTCMNSFTVYNNTTRSVMNYPNFTNRKPEARKEPIFCVRGSGSILWKDGGWGRVFVHFLGSQCSVRRDSQEVAADLPVPALMAHGLSCRRKGGSCPAGSS